MSVFRYLPIGVGALAALVMGAVVVVTVAMLATPRERRGSVGRLLLRLTLVGYVAAHLLDLLPDRFDPLHRATAWR